MLTSFFYIFILTYALGQIHFQFKDKRKQKIFEFLLGIIAVMTARLYIHTGLSMLIAGMGVTLAYKWPIAYGYKREFIGRYIIFGVFIAATPYIGILGIGIHLFFYYIFHNHLRAFLLENLLLPWIMIFLKIPDPFIILAFFSFLISLLEWIENETMEIKIRFIKISRKGLYKLMSVILVSVVVILLFFNRYVYKGFGAQMDIIRKGPDELAYIALTFDDGPDIRYTPEILDILKEKEVKATFFLVGTNVEKYPEIVKRMQEEGHSIGNHTLSHKSLIPLSNKETYREIIEGEERIQEITGEKPTLFRPPRGVYSSYALELLEENRYTMVLWDTSSEDWSELRYTDIIKKVIRKTKNGSIILFHDSGDIFKNYGGNRINTVKALPDIIDILREQEYEFVTIDELIILKGLMETDEGLH